MKAFLIKTFNGMTYGLFATLIVGVMVEQIGLLLGIGHITGPISTILKGLLGAGIGLGIAISLKKEGLMLVVGMTIGAIASSFIFNYQTLKFEFLSATNPVTVYVVTAVVFVLLKLILRKKTPIDLVMIPLLSVLLTFIITSIIGYPIHLLITLLSHGIQTATTFTPVVMTAVISLVMGMILTSPISSAGIAISLNLSGYAAGAAVVGTTVQMLGFAIQSMRDNNIGTVLSIAFGTAKFQFKNVVKKPIIWLPTMIASVILGPVYYLIFKIEGTKEGAGMGSSGLVGQLQVLSAMNYSTRSIVAVISMMVVIPGVVWIIDYIFVKNRLIEAGDLSLTTDF